MPGPEVSSIPTVDPREPRMARRDWQIWLAILAGPFAWAGQLQVNYALAPTACEMGSRGPLHLVSLVALLVAAGGALLAHRWRRRLAPGSTEQGETGSRARFMALAGTVLSLFFALLVIAAEVPNWMIPPCV